MVGYLVLARWISRSQSSVVDSLALAQNLCICHAHNAYVHRSHGLLTMNCLECKTVEQRFSCARSYMYLWVCVKGCGRRAQSTRPLTFTTAMLMTAR